MQLSNFINNSAAWGGAVYAYDNTIINFNATSNFINNSVDWDGGAIFADTNITLTFSRTVNFTNNAAITAWSRRWSIPWTKMHHFHFA